MSARSLSLAAEHYYISTQVGTDLCSDRPGFDFFISSTFELHKPYLHLLELSSGASSLKKQGTGTVGSKRHISRDCRHILTFPAHLNFISRSTSSKVLEHSSGASILKKQGNLHRWLKKVRYQAIAEIF